MLGHQLLSHRNINRKVHKIHKHIRQSFQLKVINFFYLFAYMLVNIVDIKTADKASQDIQTKMLEIIMGEVEEVKKISYLILI